MMWSLKPCEALVPVLIGCLLWPQAHCFECMAVASCALLECMETQALETPQKHC